jgi:hypothetical protein
MRVTDEAGREWHVSGGDPGSKPVNLLRRHGYDYVVLPVQTLRTGEVVAGSEPEDLVARVRLADCLEVLSG